MSPNSRGAALATLFGIAVSIGIAGLLATAGVASPAAAAIGGAISAVVILVMANLARSRVSRDLDRLEAAMDRSAAGSHDMLPQAPTSDAAPAFAAFGRMERATETRLSSVEEERRRLQQVFTLTGDGIVALAEDHRIAYCNPAAEKLFGIDAGAAAGLDLLRAVHEPAIFTLVERALASGTREVQLIDYGPQRQYVQATAVPLSGAGEWAALLVLTDLTEVRRLEAIRREFVSNVSHELRTPLASIKAVVETLDAGAIEDPPAARDFLHRVDHEVDRLTGLVEELLEISRLESGSVPLNLARIAPAAVVSGAVRRMAAQADRAGLHLEVEDRGPVPDIEGDNERLQRALINLIHNAIKFTPVGGVIRVWAEAVPTGVEFHVADDGEGIELEDQPRVFERFYKSDRARSTGGGSGLGLAIVKHVAQAHGGSVRVSSTPGEGADFTVALPAA